MKQRTPLKHGSKPLKSRTPMKRGTKPLSRGTKTLQHSRMSQKRKPKHTQNSKWASELGDRRSIVEQLYRLTSWIVLASGTKCVTCGLRAKNLLQDGHLFERRVLATAFDIPQLIAAPNNHIQCCRCNYAHEEHPQRYRQWFIKTYGREAFDTLKQRWTRAEHIDTVKLAEMRDEYEKIWQTLQSTKVGANHSSAPSARTPSRM